MSKPKYFDFSKTVFRASCINQLMTPPKDKGAADRGELGETAKSLLRKIYVQEKYGRVQDLRTKAIKKGLAVEEDAITMISLLDKEMYLKNTERLFCDHFTGEPDVFLGKDIRRAKRVDDVKSSWDLETFLGNLTPYVNKDYWGQGQIYMSLTNAPAFHLNYCLVNTPAVILEQEKKKLFYDMNVATELNPEYVEACKELERQHRFDDIPMEERRIKFLVERDDDYIRRAKDKVLHGREYLFEFQKQHLSGGFANQAALSKLREKRAQGKRATSKLKK